MRPIQIRQHVLGTSKEAAFVENRVTQFKDVAAGEDEVEVTFEDRRWVFPRGDCVLLPVANTTAELVARYIGKRLLDSMGKDTLSTETKRLSLIKDLNTYHNTQQFTALPTMGKVLKLHLELMLGKPRPKHKGEEISYKDL